MSVTFKINFIFAKLLSRWSHCSKEQRCSDWFRTMLYFGNKTRHQALSPDETNKWINKQACQSKKFEIFQRYCHSHLTFKIKFSFGKWSSDGLDLDLILQIEPFFQPAIASSSDQHSTTHQNKRGTREIVQTPDETNKQTNKQINKPETLKVFRFHRATAIKLVHL